MTKNQKRLMKNARARLKRARADLDAREKKQREEDERGMRAAEATLLQAARLLHLPGTPEALAELADVGLRLVNAGEMPTGKSLALGYLSHISRITPKPKPKRVKQ